MAFALSSIILKAKDNMLELIWRGVYIIMDGGAKAR
jgi:hypothetical protein